MKQYLIILATGFLAIIAFSLITWALFDKPDLGLIMGIITTGALLIIYIRTEPEEVKV